VIDTPLGIKIAIIGDGQVGKTCLREKFVGIAFESSPDMIKTLGADFSRKILPDKSQSVESKIELQIWDLAGQPGWIMVRKAFYAGIVGALVVFDYSRQETFDNIHDWIRELYSYNNIGHVPVIIIGNKSDLKFNAQEKGTGVQDIAVKELVDTLQTEYSDISVEFIETSAKNGYNVNEAFTNLSVKALELLRRLQLEHDKINQER